MCKGCAVKHIAAAVAKRKTPWCPSCRKDYNQFDECQLQLEPLKMGSSLDRPVGVVDRYDVRSVDETHFIAGSVTRVNGVGEFFLLKNIFLLDSFELLSSQIFTSTPLKILSPMFVVC
jgi:hypothetical protein